jgi:hypothetical protein
MAKAIKRIADRVEFAIKKGHTGYISPETMSEETYAEVLNVWRKYIDEYAKTQKLSLYLKPFERIESVTGLAGGTAEGTKAVTSCYEYPLSIITTSNRKKVTKLTIGEYEHWFNHPTKPPTADYPICKFVGNTIYVAPKLDVSVTYIATPIKPVYAYTQVGDDYIYDDTNSVDVELPPVLHDDLVNRVLSNMGIAMRDGQLTQFSDQQKVMENR